MRCMVTCNIIISIITYHKIEVLPAILHLGDNEYQVEEIVFQMAHWSQIFSSNPHIVFSVNSRVMESGDQ